MLDYNTELSTSSDECYNDCDDIDFTWDILKNQYIILEKLGNGTFASVWLSYNINTRQFNAIKIQNPEDDEEAEFEIELLKKIKKTKCKYLSNLVDDFIYKPDDDTKHICMVFELLFGSVHDIIRKGKYQNGLPFHIVKDIVYQTLFAINTLHDSLGIIHTDIKPENVLLFGISDKIKIIIAF